MTVKVERPEDGIAVVTYDNPPVNAVNATMFSEITETFEQLSEDRSVRAVILTGGGERVFMAGADLKAPRGQQGQEGAGPPASKATDSGRGARKAFWAVYDCDVPVIAAVNGPALGAGMVFVAVSDFIVAADHARFGMTEINVGLLGGGAFLQRLLGPVRARKLFMTGRQVPAKEFLELGVVDAVVPVTELLDKAMELARELAAKSPIAMRLAKESLNRIEGLSLKDAYRTEQDYTSRLLAFEDSAEARAAFAEKRAPEWHWR
jgi:enoyl-CoA hydratase